MSSPPFKNIMLVGAGGSIGSVVLEALLAEPSFTVTALQRASSKTKLPSHVKVVTVPDSYPSADLETAFKGQDAVINCMTTVAIADQYRMIDAAIAAGVRRYSPSEYGLNNMRPEAQALNSVFALKGAVQAYLRAKAAEGKIEWMSIACGTWVAWSINHDFMGLRVKERRFEQLDDGETRSSCSTQESTAQAAVAALTKGVEETRNRVVYVQDFVVTQKELLAEVERQMGEKFTVDVFDSRKLAEQKQAEAKAGDMWATVALINIGLMSGDYGALFEKEGEIMNEKLGIPKSTLAAEVAKGLRELREARN
ncbi:hypothetical protein B0T19DRAFT_423940 [Cercophora scortea]|uniref:NmrA-like domain-containing protein n=1 Tax=Cercophora scortea TaxID=314031 RepID=A0AAE0MD61_9PEZI|nr:hypothetical protein B0T19DRAFT_423940 [Cercophora scortea]